MFLHNLEREEFLDLYDASRVQIEQDKDSRGREIAQRNKARWKENAYPPL